MRHHALAALGYLTARRFLNPQVRYVSLFADYFPLFLLLLIALSGVTLRHILKTDVVGIKALALGLDVVIAFDSNWRTLNFPFALHVNILGPVHHDFCDRIVV